MHSSTPLPRLPRAHQVLLAAGAVLVAGCSSDDDDSGGTPGVVNTATAFTSSLDRVQTTNSATLGSAVRVTVRNEAPDTGTFLTPVWIGFHDGSFDIYDQGVAATAGLESLAEDGDAAALGAEFQASGAGTVEGLLTGVLGPMEGPIAPGETVSGVFRLSGTDASARYVSYASMVIPSNDAFVANGNPMALEVFDAGGAFQAPGLTDAGTDVLDAGTEVNDESTTNTAFFGQAAPNTGTTEGGVVTNHPGFLAAGMGGILDDAMFAGADFENVPGYEVLTISLEEVSTIAEPTGFATATLNEGTMQLSIDLSVGGLSGDVTVAHLHRGTAGVAGPVEVDLAPIFAVNAGGTFTASGTVSVTADQIALLRAGEMYFNVHTSLNPMGEVRGQVAANDAATAPLGAGAVTTPPIQGTELRITAQNRAPSLGTLQTPVWFGLHNGTFDFVDVGSPSSPEFERLAEDGNVEPLGGLFSASSSGTVSGVIASPGGPLAPGATATVRLRVDPSASTNRYFSWASMVIPSNDAFVATDAPMETELFDAGGSFVGAGFTFPAARIYDAGTEVNDEIPANTAAFGQATPDTGTTEVANIAAHPGFLAPGMGGILDDMNFAGADFAN
ncbi:MAG: spondin domain-containing protein, partial [Planctomycetota bacterium]